MQNIPHTTKSLVGQMKMLHISNYERGLSYGKYPEASKSKHSDPDYHQIYSTMKFFEQN
jgi:hypothetical protein